MSRQKSMLALIIGLLCSQSAVALGAFYLGSDLFYRSYSEKVTPPGKSDEYGVLYGIYAGYEYVTAQKLYWDINGYIASAQVTYDGSLFFKPEVPVNSKTFTLLAGIEGRLGYNVYEDSLVSVTPYVGVGYEYWDRGGMTDLVNREEYYMPYGAVGIKTNYRIANPLSIGLNIKFGYMFKARMIHISQPDKVFHLGDAFRFDVECPIHWGDDTTRVNGLEIIPYYRRHAINRSNVVSCLMRRPGSLTKESVACVEPASTTHVWGVKLGYKF